MFTFTGVVNLVWLESFNVMAWFYHFAFIRWCSYLLLDILAWNLLAKVSDFWIVYLVGGDICRTWVHYLSSCTSKYLFWFLGTFFVGEVVSRTLFSKTTSYVNASCDVCYALSPSLGLTFIHMGVLHNMTEWICFVFLAGIFENRAWEEEGNVLPNEKICN